jgi:protein licB
MGYFFGGISGFFWALSGVLYSYLYINYPNFNAIGVVLYILLLSEVFSFLNLSVIFFFKSRKLPKLKIKYTIFPFVSGVLGGALGMYTYLMSIQYIGIEYTALLSSSYPAIASVLACIFLKDKLNSFGVIGFFILIISSAMLILPSYQHKDLDYFYFIFVCICSIGWSLEVVLSSYAMKFIPSEFVYAIRVLGAISGYFVIILFNKVEIYSLLHLLTARNSSIILFILASGFLSYFYYYKSIGLIGPIRAITMNITYTIWTVIMSCLFLDININLITALCCLGIFVGTYITLSSRKVPL